MSNKDDLLLIKFAKLYQHFLSHDQEHIVSICSETYKNDSTRTTFLSSANFSLFKTQSSIPVQLILLKLGLQKRVHLLGITPFILY